MIFYLVALDVPVLDGLPSVLHGDPLILGFRGVVLSCLWNQSFKDVLELIFCHFTSFGIIRDIFSTF